MRDFLDIWFKDLKGFTYIEHNKSFIPCSELTNISGCIGLYPRLRKRNSASDVRVLPGLIVDKPFPVEANCKSGNSYIYILDEPIIIESKATEKALSRLLGIDISQMKLESIDLDKLVIINMSIVHSLEQIVSVHVQPQTLPEPEVCSAPEHLKQILEVGYTQSLYGGKFVTDITIAEQLFAESLSAGQVRYLFQAYLEEDRLSLFIGLLATNNQTAPNLGNEYLFNGQDGIYHAVLRKDKYDITRISNFTMHPTHTVTINEDEILHCVLHIEGNESYPIYCHFHKTDLMGWKEFIRAIPSSRVLWLAKDREVQLIRGWIHNLNIPNKIGVDKIGLHKDRYILVNGSVKNGEYIRDDDYVYSDPYIPVIAEEDISIANFKSLAEELLQNCLLINDSKMTQIAMAWFLASPLSELFREVNGNFPLLQVWGTKGSGKTTMASTFAKLFGSVGEPKSCNRTPFSLLKDMSLSNAVPVVMDEYKPAEIPIQRLDSLHYSLRMSYNGMQDTRGKANFTIQTFSLTTPVVISGEMPFIDPALTERALILNLRPQYVKSHPEAVEAYNKVLDTKTGAFLVGYLKWLTQTSMDDLKNQIMDCLELSKSITQGKGVPLRVIQNLSVVIFGIRVLNTLVGLNLSEQKVIEEYLLMTAENNVTDSLNRFMEHVNNMVLKGTIILNREYTVIDNKLFFATDPVIASLSQYCQQHNLRTEITSREAIRQMLLESKDSGGYVVEAYGKVQRMPNGRSVRCTIIDLQKLEQLTGINVSSWQLDGGPEVVV